MSSKILCTNCKHNRTKACGKEAETDKRDFPKVTECSDYGFTPAFVYKLEALYAKFHTEK